MVHAHAAPHFFHDGQRLDGKRIVATAFVVALHLALLMMLMMPAQVSRTAVEEEEPPFWFVPEVTIKPPPPPPVPKPDPRPLPRTPVAASVPIPDVQVEPVDQTASAVDTQAMELDTTPTDFAPVATQSFFTELVPRVRPAPPYPRQAVLRHLTGTVTLRLHVDASGRPIEVSVERSSGSTLLDETAMKFVKARWLFVPALRDGQPVEAWALLPIDFVLQ